MDEIDRAIAEFEAAKAAKGRYIDLRDNLKSNVLRELYGNGTSLIP